MTSQTDNNTEIMVALARIETKQGAMHEDVTEIKGDVQDQTGRVRKLEIRNGFLWGGLGVVGIIVPFVIKYVL